MAPGGGGAAAAVMADAMVGNVAPRTGLEPGHLVFDANFESGEVPEEGTMGPGPG